MHITNRYPEHGMSSFIDPVSRARVTNAFLRATVYLSAAGAIGFLIMSLPGRRLPIALTSPLLLLFGLVQMALIAATAFNYFHWFHCAWSNLEPLGDKDPSTTAPRAIAGYFVPLINLIAPYVHVKELLKSTASTGKSRTPSAGLWWGCWLGWLGSMVLWQLSTRLPVSGEAVSAGTQVVANLFLALSGLSLMRIIRFVSEEQRETARIRSIIVDTAERRRWNRGLALWLGVLLILSSSTAGHIWLLRDLTGVGRRMSHLQQASFEAAARNGITGSIVMLLGFVVLSGLLAAWATSHTVQSESDEMTNRTQNWETPVLNLLNASEFVRSLWHESASGARAAGFGWDLLLVGTFLSAAGVITFPNRPLGNLDQVAPASMLILLGCVAVMLGSVVAVTSVIRIGRQQWPVSVERAPQPIDEVSVLVEAEIGSTSDAVDPIDRIVADLQTSARSLRVLLIAGSALIMTLLAGSATLIGFAFWSGSGSSIRLPLWGALIVGTLGIAPIVHLRRRLHACRALHTTESLTGIDEVLGHEAMFWSSVIPFVSLTLLLSAAAFVAHFGSSWS